MKREVDKQDSQKEKTKTPSRQCSYLFLGIDVIVENEGLVGALLECGAQHLRAFEFAFAISTEHSVRVRQGACRTRVALRSYEGEDLYSL